MASEDALKIAVDKQATLAVAKELGIAVPRTAVVDQLDDVADVMDEIGYPAVIKPRWSWARDFGGERLFPSAVLNHDEAVNAIAQLQNAGAPVLVQELLTGEREGLSMFRAGGKIVGEFAHLSLRTTPMLGGACAVRESIQMPADLRAAAVALINTIELDGYSQIEFRRDSTGRPVLMEINPRLSGSVELATRSGVDFPLMIWQWASGARVVESSGYRSGVRLRWLTGDGRWLMETLRSPGRPDSMPAGRAIAAFVGDFTRKNGYDYVDAGDPLPAIAEAGRVLGKLGRKVVGGRRPVGPVVGADGAGALWYGEK
jgi:predicted ATP-grasp superfamily ATP-dependent carboligase